MFSSRALILLLTWSAIRSLAFRVLACFFFFIAHRFMFICWLERNQCRELRCWEVGGGWNTQTAVIHRTIFAEYLSSSQLQRAGTASSWFRKTLRWEIVRAGVSLRPFSFLRRLPFSGIPCFKNHMTALKLRRTLTFPVHVLCIQSDFRANWMDFFVRTRLSPDR